MNKQNENKHIDTENRVVVTRRDRRSGEGEMHKRGQLYRDGWKLNFGW